MCCLNFFQINMHFVKRSSLLPIPVDDNSCSGVLRIYKIYTKIEAKKNAGFGKFRTLPNIIRKLNPIKQTT